MATRPAPHSPDEVSARARPAAAPLARGRRWLLPFAIVAASAAVAAALVASRPVVATAPPDVLPPLVRVLAVEKQGFQLVVLAQGSVEPRTESDLVAEVPGRVIWAAPGLAAGGFFEDGEALLRLDARESDVAARRASALVARAESEALQAERNLERRRALAAQDMASRAVVEDAEHAVRVSRAALEEARAALTQARLDLERSEIRAPFAGRLRDVRVDVGQFVGRGTPLARIFSVDHAEVRLLVPDEDLAHLDLPLDLRGAELADGPAVTLRARLAGRELAWPARIVRTEAAIDPATRMVPLVARVDDPYARRDPARAPLPVGTFVDAEIAGRSLPDAVVLPRAALRGEDRVIVVDAEDRLRFRQVEVARRDRERAVVVGGLEAGERVLLSSLDAATEGMHVRASAEEPRP
jgi:RND family efflux transporter MFP subunit